MADTPVDKAVAFTLENWEALGIVDQGGVLHMPAKIQRRNAKGLVDETTVMLRNVTNAHKHTCRVSARKHALSIDLDLDRDKDLIDDIENYAILAFAIRDAQPPFIQHVPDVATLIKTYDAQSLATLWGVYNSWVEMLDPRFGELSAEQLWQTIVRVANEANTSPLVELPGYAQHTCIVLMAREALRSPTRPSWLQPSEISRRAS